MLTILSIVWTSWKQSEGEAHGLTSCESVIIFSFLDLNRKDTNPVLVTSDDQNHAAH